MYKKNGLVYFSCDENKENYSQRNNEFTWTKGEAIVRSYTMCNVTSMCMALDYAGYKLPEGKYKQPEDNLADFLLSSEEVSDYYKKIDPVSWKAWQDGKKDAITPNEYHAVLSYGTNLWMGRNVTKFSTTVDFKNALFLNFAAGSLPLVVSGSFPKSDGKRLGHIVTVTGVVYKEADYNKALKDSVIPTPVAIKVDDPYGNTLKDWQGSGNDIELTWDYVIANLKPLNSGIIKWAHTFIEAPALV